MVHAVMWSVMIAVTPRFSKAADLELGKPHSTVVTLGSSNFRPAIQDPANPFWLLKLYAPWCGHCKKLAPVLDAVAPYLAGQMAIGKVDCTVEKKLCDEFGVRGYPTLKFSYDGEIYDYPGGRSKDEIIAFSEKMNKPVVQAVDSVAEAWKYAKEQAEDGVIFLAYSPQAANEDAEETYLAQVFAQVARKQRAFGHFLMLPSSTPDLASISGQSPEKPFICRLEENIDPICFDPIEKVDSVKLLKFVEEKNVPTVIKLGPHNFGKIGRKGRPLVIGVLDTSNEDQVANMKRNLSRYATSGPENVRNQYYYGWIDVKQWAKFLAQFNVLPEESPQIFVLNVPDKRFWQSATYGTDVGGLLAAIQDGSLKPGTAGPGGVQGVIDRLYSLLVNYRPWSVVVLVLVVVAVAVAIASLVSPPEYPHELPPDPLADVFQEGEETTPEPSKPEGPKESKKDK